MLEKVLQDEGFASWELLPLSAPQHLAFFHSWLDKGFHGEMDYLEKRRELYRDPSSLLPGAKSILIVSVPFTRTPNPASRSTQFPGIATYAQRRDYHRVLRKRLTRALTKYREDTDSPFSFRVFVDTSPILERDYAVQGGLGWIGKNCCLIHPEHGSHLFLAGAVTSKPCESAADLTTMRDQCGRCKRCIEACPTGALKEPYLLDSRKCLSYLTIEYKGSDDGGIPNRHGWLFGCDICQDVCPYNRDPKSSSGQKLTPKPELLITMDELLSMNQAAYEKWSEGTPLRRMNWERFKRNLKLLTTQTAGKESFPPLNPNLRKYLLDALSEIGIHKPAMIRWNQQELILSSGGKTIEAQENEGWNRLMELCRSIQLMKDFEITLVPDSCENLQPDSGNSGTNLG